MVTKRLEMVFLNTAGRRTTIAVVEPKDDLTPESIRAAMELIIAKNLFNSTGGDLVAVDTARVVMRDVVEFVI